MTMKGHSWFQRSQNLEYPTDGLPVLTQISVYVLQSPCFVRFDGRSLTSILLKPGTRPGKRRACSSAVFKINFTTCSTVSAGDVLVGSRFLFQCTRRLFYNNVSLGCRNDSCGGSVEREMFSCRFFGCGSSIPFLYTVDFFLFCQKCWFRYSSTNIGQLPIQPGQVQWTKAHCSYFYSLRNHQSWALCYRASHLRLTRIGTFLRRTSLPLFSRKRVLPENQNPSAACPRGHHNCPNCCFQSLNQPFLHHFLELQRTSLIHFVTVVDLPDLNLNTDIHRDHAPW